MKKIVLLTTLVILAINLSQAQVIEKTKVKPTKQVPVKLGKIIPPDPAPLPPATPVNKTTDPGTANVLVYTLTSVRVKIRTGNDNKEFPSMVYALLRTKNTPNGTWNPFSQTHLDNEMKINSDTEFGLERQPQGEGEVKLDVFQAEGLKFVIRYRPNFFADAWKIENITLTLEFKDQHGDLHPTLGNKTIVFSNAYGFLNNDYPIMECVTDGSFSPLTAMIKK